MVLKRDVSRVPDPKLIRKVTVGLDSSTSVVGGDEAVVADEETGAADSEMKAPGMDGIPGVGLPRR